MPNIPCQLALKECLPCNDSPIANLTAEEPDIDVFISFRDFRGNPPLGVVYAQLGCKSICFSNVSQQEADDCADRQAKECVWRTWQPPQVPPLPPGPNNTGGKGTPSNTPGGVPPIPRFPIRRFLNARQECDKPCPDGTPFTGVVPAGTVVALSQAAADAQALSLACKRALQDRICFESDLLPTVCIGDAFFFQLIANGGTWFDSHDYIWQITDGSLPVGVEIDPDFGLISGLPVASGAYTFTVQITDSLGHSQSKQFTICVVEILSPSLLPDATEGDAYAQPLIEEPADVSSEVWTLVTGTLPPGLTLAANGAISGTPTELGSYEFRLRVEATCSGSPVSCEKTFTLEVVSGVDCMGAVEEIQLATWVDTSNPVCSFTMIAGDGTFSATPSPTAQSRIVLAAPICNPKLEAYDLTFEWNWTGSGFTSGIANATRVIIRIDGVDVDISPTFNANGVFSHTQVVSLPSGVHTAPDGITARIVCTAGGLVPPAIITGTCTIRPLTPPP